MELYEEESVKKGVISAHKSKEYPGQLLSFFTKRNQLDNQSGFASDLLKSATIVFL